MNKAIRFLPLLIVFFVQSLATTASTRLPLETIYVQTDRKSYFTGETIWFRAFLLDAETFVQVTSSRYIYAELINEHNEVKDRVMIRHDENGVFAGHFLITDNLEAGTYILRFFTRHLESFGEKYFFQRVIQIITPQSLESPQSPESPPVPSQYFTVSFHPEGGDIPVGVYTRVAFKALNSSGLGENVSGTVVNENGDIVTEFRSAHRGMGYFVLNVDRNQQLFANVRNSAGVEKQFPLPRATNETVALQLFRENDDVIIHVPNAGDRTLYLTLQHRGHVLYFEPWGANDELIIPEIHLPTGVIGVTISDERGVPISHRQFFNISPLDVVNTSFTTDREVYGPRERVNATVFITDIDNQPLIANFSISVIDHDAVLYDTAVNILSTLLLTSDLPGFIEDPAYYFIPENAYAQAHLDLVMLTHGWSRFEVQPIFQEEILTLWQEVEWGQTIEGSLQGTRSRIANQLVTLLAPDNNFFEQTYTDAQGRFRFQGFEFPEGTQFVLQGREGTEIRVSPTSFPAVSSLFIPSIRSSERFFIHEQIEEFDRRMVDDDVWSLELGELVVRGLRPTVRNPREHLFSSPFNPRRERDELESLRAPNLFMLVQWAFPNLRLYQNPNQPLPILFIPRLQQPRGEGSQPQPPLVFIDNVAFGFQELHFFSADNVASIELVQTVAESAIFGLTGGYAGYILITTHNEGHARSNTPHITSIIPLGYQITRHFFAPAYTTDAQRQNPQPDLRNTLFWNPSVRTNETGNAHIHFYTSDHVGNYVAVIEGVTDEGRIVHAIERIR